MNLNDLKPGQKGKVTKLLGLGYLRRRIIDMGIIPGTTILMKRVAPFGDPIQINVRGYELSIRKSEAQEILIDAIKGDIDQCQ